MLLAPGSTRLGSRRLAALRARVGPFFLPSLAGGKPLTEPRGRRRRLRGGHPAIVESQLAGALLEDRFHAASDRARRN